MRRFSLCFSGSGLRETVCHKSVYKEGKGMIDRSVCQNDLLFVTRNCAVRKCHCGIYHVRIGSSMLHLTAVQFTEVARVFKLMMGRLAALDMSASKLSPGLSQRSRSRLSERAGKEVGST